MTPLLENDRAISSAVSAFHALQQASTMASLSKMRLRGPVGIRIMMRKEAKRDPNDPGLDRIARAAIEHDLPVNILFWHAGTAVIDRPSGRALMNTLQSIRPGGYAHHPPLTRQGRPPMLRRTLAVTTALIASHAWEGGVAARDQGYPAVPLLSTETNVVGETLRYPTSGAAHVTAAVVTLAPGSGRLFTNMACPCSPIYWRAN